MLLANAVVRVQFASRQIACAPRRGVKLATDFSDIRVTINEFVLGRLTGQAIRQSASAISACCRYLELGSRARLRKIFCGEFSAIDGKIYVI